MLNICYITDRSTRYWKEVMDNAKDAWAQLCQRASKEQDPDKLLQLILEINNILEEQRSQLKKEETNA
jgi:hypothetical protein